MQIQKKRLFWIFLLASIGLSCTMDSCIEEEVKCEIDTNNTTLRSDPLLSKKEGLYYYDNEIFCGRIVSYFPSGELAYRADICNGKEDGVRLEYGKANSLRSIKTFVKGLKNGIHYHYRKDGHLKIEEEYDQDTLHGAIKLYHPNGQLKALQNYYKGNKEGLQTYWDNKGQLVKEYLIDNDQIVEENNAIRL